MAPRLAVLAAGLAAALASGCGAAPDRIVLVTIDTLRADHVGAYGAKRARTRALDALAAEGTRFETALSPAPLTLPSHATLLTGLEPIHHGVRDNALFRLPEDVETLATRLQARGFATAAFVGAVVLDRQYGLARGFDRYDDRMGGRFASGDHGFAERRATEVVESALGWLADAPERFLLWVHLYDPHADYDPPPGFLAAVPGDPYSAEIAYADAELARLRTAVEARYGAEGTLWIATSDHGESRGQHGEVTHGLTLYDATQRVPLVLAGPGVPAGRVVSTPVGLIDVAPTVLALFGEPPLPDADGRDLRPLLGTGPEAPDAQRSFLLESVATRLMLGWSPVFALRSASHKLVRAPRPEVYDLERDPGETLDRSGEAAFADARDALAAELEIRLSTAREPSWRTAAPDSTERAALEALGYVVASLQPDADLHAVSGPDPKDGLPGMAAIAHATSYLHLDRPGEAEVLLGRVPWEGRFVDTLRAEAARRAGDPGGALVYAERAVAAAPGALLPRIERARTLEALGRLDEAERAYDEGRNLDTAAALPLVGLGRVAERRGERDEARALYEEARVRRSGSIEAVWRLAALAIEAGDSEGADVLLAELPVTALQRPHAAARLARAELGAGREERARERVGAAIERRPDSVTLRPIAQQLGLAVPVSSASGAAPSR